MKYLVYVIILSSIMAYAKVPHIEPGAQAQDEAVALAIDEGLTQSKYLELSYGNFASQMLDEAIVARSKYFYETPEVIKNASFGDARNIPCIEPGTKENYLYLRFRNKNKAWFKPDHEVPVSGRMFGSTNALSDLTKQFFNRVGKKILITNNGKVHSAGFIGGTIYNKFDKNGVSYSWWPLGVAIHSNDSYAEEISHFFNFSDPRIRLTSVSNTFSNVDYSKVSRWNEFISAFRGIKVHALTEGYNLNNEGQFTNYFYDVSINLYPVYEVGEDSSIITNVPKWMTRGSSPLPTNSLVLLNAYMESIEHEGEESDNAGYRRIREWCRDPEVSSMIL